MTEKIIKECLGILQEGFDQDFIRISNKVFSDLKNDSFLQDKLPAESALLIVSGIMYEHFESPPKDDKELEELLKKQSLLPDTFEASYDTKQKWEFGRKLQKSYKSSFK